MLESIGVIQVSNERSQVPRSGNGRDGKKSLDFQFIIKVKQQVLLWDWPWSVGREELGLF